VTSRSPVTPHRDGAIIELAVQPRAARTELTGIHDGALRLRVTAPPVDGAANAAVLDYLARQLGVSRSKLEIVGGQTSRRKRVLVRGLDEHDVREQLGIPTP
jgi:uncharacterized protein (TIGR00251 family)